MNKQKKLLLVDGNSVSFRAFFALHQSLERFVNHNGLHTTAIYGFKNMLDKIIEKVQPSHILVAFDAGKKTFRTKKFDEYKGGRSKTPSELSEQFPYIRNLLTAYGIKSYELANFEADDIIGTLANEAENQGFKVTVVTGDRDLTQLTTDKTTVAVTQKGVTEVEEYTPAHVFEKLGIRPDQIIDMKGLVGDNSDNYPGVTKVGEKTAIKLLKQFETIEGIYENLDSIKASKMKEHLIEDRELAFLCKDLARILRNAPIEVTVDDAKWSGPVEEELRSFYEEMDFKSFLAKMSSPSSDNNLQTKQNKTPKLEYQKLDKQNSNSLVFEKNTTVSFYLEMSGENYHQAQFAGFALKIGSKIYVSRDVELLKKANIKELLENKAVKIDLFDGKRTFVGLKRLDIDLASVDFDMLLVSYLLDSSDNNNDFGKLAHQHDYFDVASDEEVYGKGAKYQIPAEDDVFFEHLAGKVQAIEQLKESLMKKLYENKQEELYFEIERPLSLVLGEMEVAGIRLDKSRLEEMSSKLKERLTELEQAIHTEAGEDFNINSPKQLGVILFEKLKLPVIKKTKTGYSTAVGVLEELRGMAPIIDNILKYRQIAKIQSTYVEGLLKVVSQKDGKVHTRYTQTLTATGRLSSVDPNLQNIPVRLEEGRQIRKAFVPEKAGWEIFSSDYSQIELRVLAHISHDKNMQAAFNEGADIHANTAMQIFGLDSASEVTSNMRRQAKAVNFGIVYGISDYGLAQNIGITRKQAKSFITRYFEIFPGVKQYMDEIVEKAHEQGYVETLFKRRRYLPEIKSKNFNLRSFAERTAMNTPIQGSAADIIKVAMINMQKMLRREKFEAKMLLQVHDELIFEVPDKEIAALEKFVPKVMDQAVSLEVPLKVESAHGKTWFDAK
ncbi:DNA polymerase I [Liquorilactobacillus mali]|uniref:DNA polymerase I n=1 Tax=Liquorilactobacillus mali KCTC 3596 = DSM 20444 TaxID=1046596 RepID=J0UQM9_9LACO|nr:DNA polymerase I [Liquorilactobacillus mali]EJE98262.1 DNA polymerase I [Liquorilactobacillus mali KCTC 3596 = DSM 20444]KRN10496.1 DNA polymerase I [Liquorilactobacillus mali KCTC 3596 = DSM 20444]MDC7951862.1 DNA polymerase I [Liquorilactobacillus mali]MDV7757077.1 DNA polymerase I [Liquorilactobacillus mali]QFQ75085.1 DNA polymerase I [Liquorilactobacillus mali]